MDSKLMDAPRRSRQRQTLSRSARSSTKEIVNPEPLVRFRFDGEPSRPHRGGNRTGKTKTLQLIAEQLSAAGVPVFVSDIKGDLPGLVLRATQ